MCTAQQHGEFRTTMKACARSDGHLHLRVTGEVKEILPIGSWCLGGSAIIATTDTVTTLVSKINAPSMFRCTRLQNNNLFAIYFEFEATFLAENSELLTSHFSCRLERVNGPDSAALLPAFSVRGHATALCAERRVHRFVDSQFTCPGEYVSGGLLSPSPFLVVTSSTSKAYGP